VIELHEFHRQVRLELVHDQTGATIAGVDDHFERLERGGVDITEQVIDAAVDSRSSAASAAARCRS
jgi:hypothetical protein